MTDNPSITIYINKIETRITFKTRNAYNLERLALETMKLFESYNNKLTKDKNSENMYHI